MECSYFNSGILEYFQDLFHILVCQETQIGTSWHDILGLGFEFFARLVEIYFLRAKDEGMSIIVNAF